MKNNKRLAKFKNILELLPIIIFSSLVPLIVYTKYVELSDVVAAGHLSLDISTDVFAYYKMVIILICAATALIILLYKLIVKEIKIKLQLTIVMLAVYGALTLLSSIFSTYPSVAFWGGPERNEGAVVIFAYIIMFLYTIHIADTMKKIRIVMVSAVISTVIITFIGALQFYGLDVFRRPFFTRLLNMDYTEAHPYYLSPSMSKNTSYSTLSSSNYMGMYLALIIPSIFAFFALRKSNAGRVGASLLIYACAANLIGASSGGGYYAVGLTLVILLFLAFPYIKRNIINVAMMSVIVISLLLVTNIFMDNIVAERLSLKRISSELSIGEDVDTSIYIDDIILDKDSVFINTTDKDFTVTNKLGKITVTDTDASTIPVFVYAEVEEDTFNGIVILFENPEYKNYIIIVNNEYSIFVVKAGLREMPFHMTEDGIKVPGIAYSLNFIEPIERNEFLYTKVRNFHGRGYIWAVAIPMLRDTIFIGNGPDTFFLHFPQNDYIGKINMTGHYSSVIGKPHNYFIQVAHDSGFIALLAMLTAFVYYIINTIICLIKDKRKNEARAYSIAIMCGIIGYLVSALGFDSNVNVAPVFWTLLALGVSLNIISKNTSIDKDTKKSTEISSAKLDEIM